jgi:hypothetical protein
LRCRVFHRRGAKYAKDLLNTKLFLQSSKYLIYNIILADNQCGNKFVFLLFNLLTYMVPKGGELYPEVVWKTVITLQDILVIYKGDMACRAS